MQTLSPEDMSLALSIKDFLLNNLSRTYTQKEIEKLYPALTDYFWRRKMPLVCDNKSVAQFVFEKRMEAAAAQLLSNDENLSPVKTVAADVGYGSPEAFIHAFEKYYKMTPGEYVHIKKNP